MRTLYMIIAVIVTQLFILALWYLCGGSFDLDEGSYILGLLIGCASMTGGNVAISYYDYKKLRS